MTQEISPELVERMVALVRDLHADHVANDMHDRVQDFVARTAAVMADLPAPVDPDLIEAREIAASIPDRHGENTDDLDADIRAGIEDDHHSVVCALAGLKRGRELERQS